MKKKRPQKIENLLNRIKECLTEYRYTQTEHAVVRQGERNITLPEIKHVLMTGTKKKLRQGLTSSIKPGIMQLEGKQR